ncbi:sperm-associated antigen 4 protein-like isoform X2 [Mycteria americana]|uniref:sperm-associated antigen 4 protein-like isoform X2 n=1 Tax=Mycteria americana TaxID=33587 RepID=UPI003F58E282
MGKGEGGPLAAAQLCCPLSLQLACPLGGFPRPTSGKGLGSHSVGTVGNKHFSCSSYRSLCTEVELVARFLRSTPSSAGQGPAKWRKKATEAARTVFGLACHAAGALVSLWRHLMSMCVFTTTPSFSGKRWPCRRRGSWKSSSCCSHWLLELTCASAAQLKILRSSRALLAEQTQKMQLLLQEVAQLTAEIRSGKKEVWEVNQAVSDMASEVYVKTSDWALKSSGATIDMQRTSETYDCKKEWICRVLWFFCTANPPDTILQPDVSPGNCWPLQGHQGQVVIRLPARVHLTAVSVQHISKDVSPSGTVISAPRDVAVFGLDADGEEEALLGTFMYNVAKEAIQTFPLKNAPLPRAFSYIKLLVKSNWGNPAYTCIYRVQVHGKMAKPESVD